MEDRVAFCVASGSYLLPTTELVAALKAAIGGRTALEIGSGSGVLAKALGIRATDNRMQEWPEVKKLYGSLQQAVVTYGENVEEIDAEEAVRKYKPQVVVAAWVTHKYDPARPYAGGNEHGVIEENIIDNCETYIFVGNSKVHANKSIWARPHTWIEPPWLYSRAINGSPNFIAAWGKSADRIISRVR